MAKKEDKNKKVKRPTAEKRMIQNTKKRQQNREFKSQVRTAMRRFEDALTGRHKDQAQEKINVIFSLMDKGVKKGVFKLNKASRTKSRLTAKMAKA